MALTLKHVDDIINIAAREGRVYHYNGGQVYIRVSKHSTALMVIDHTTAEVQTSLHDGTDYFRQCAGFNVGYSDRLIANPSQLALLFA
jgi:hypothetical protein